MLLLDDWYPVAPVVFSASRVEPYPFEVENDGRAQRT